jgi:hypothetical protein
VDIDKGKIGEYKFASAALEHGFLVAWPSSLHAYDFLLDTGERTVKVQVKSCFSKAVSHDSFQVNLKRTTRYKQTKGQKYQQGDFDYLAVYIEPANAFYLIPFGAVAKSSSLYFYPHRNDCTGAFEKYLENWEVLNHE